MEVFVVQVNQADRAGRGPPAGPARDGRCVSRGVEECLFFRVIRKEIGLETLTLVDR